MPPAAKGLRPLETHYFKQLQFQNWGIGMPSWNCAAVCEGELWSRDRGPGGNDSPRRVQGGALAVVSIWVTGVSRPGCRAL